MNLTFKPLGQEYETAITDCFANDAAGMRRTAFYSEPQKLLRLIDGISRFAWGVLENVSLIGLVDLDIVSDGVGAFTVYICPSYRGKRYCPALIEAFLLIPPVTQLKRLVGYVEEDNHASIRCLRAQGFVEKGEDEDGLIEMEKDLSGKVKELHASARTP